MASDFYRSLKGKIKGELFRGRPLAPLVSFRIGGPAQFLLYPKNEGDLMVAMSMAQEHQVPVHILGAGSNLLVGDRGVKGLVIYLAAGLSGNWRKISESKKQVLYRVPAHWPKAKLLERSLSSNLSGLEFSAGIPGTLGGAVYMNAGTKWGSYADVIKKVRLYSLDGGVIERRVQDMGFTYRGHGEGLLDGKTVVLSVDISLKKEKTSLKSRKLVDEILAYRGSKQPLELPNCGSVFKNPKNSPRGAGRLVEACGLKGRRYGRAMISLKHANFILNLGGARASEVRYLLRLAQKEVYKKFKIDLEPEVIFL